MWFDVYATNKFRGQYMEIQPNGTFHLEFKNTGNHYTWNKAKTCVNNILIGKMWSNVQGEETLVNHKTKDVCLLKYMPCGMFSNDSVNKVVGVIKDSSHVAKYVLEGVCTDMLEFSVVKNPQVVKCIEDIKKLSKGTPQFLWKRNPQP